MKEFKVKSGIMEVGEHRYCSEKGDTYDVLKEIEQNKGQCESVRSDSEVTYYSIPDRAIVTFCYNDNKKIIREQF